MHKRTMLDWLYKQLPGLVDNGIISDDQAVRIKEHFGPCTAINKKQTALVLFSVIGATLIGLGIVLLFAHNWKMLSRPTRAVIAFLPLITSAIFVLRYVKKGIDSLSWREGLGIFWATSVIIVLALIGQTYNNSGDFESFLLITMILTAPIIYILSATLPLLIYCIGITTYACYAQNSGGHALFFWILFGAIIPYCLSLYKKNRYSQRATFTSWILCYCLTIATGVSLEKVLPGLWIIIYPSLFVIFYLVGGLWFYDAPSWWQKPFHTFGILAISFFTWLLTFTWPWGEVGFHYYRSGLRFHVPAAIIDYILAVGLPITALLLLRYSVQQNKKALFHFSVIPVIFIAGYVLVNLGGYIMLLGMVSILNMYVLFLSLKTIQSGIKKLELGTLNAGMLFLALLIISRFFDIDMSFVIRGIIFIILGIAFLVANTTLIKRKGGAA